jgi:hypothetical protein
MLSPGNPNAAIANYVSPPSLGLSAEQLNNARCSCDANFLPSGTKSLPEIWKTVATTTTKGDDAVAAFKAQIASSAALPEQVSDLMCRYTNLVDPRSKAAGPPPGTANWLKEKLNSGFMRTLLILLVYGMLMHLFFRLLFPKRGNYEDSLAYALWTPQDFFKNQTGLKQKVSMAFFLVFIIIALVIYWTSGKLFKGIFEHAVPTNLNLASGDFWKGLLKTWPIWLVVLMILGAGLARVAPSNSVFINGLSWVLSALPNMAMATFFVVLNFVIAALVPGAELLFLIFYRFGFGLFRAAKTENSALKGVSNALLGILGIRDTDKWVMPFVPFMAHFVRLFYAISGDSKPGYFRPGDSLTGVSNTDMWLS